MNFLKVFYNSFFRTLGRIVVYILVGLVFSIILSKIDVHADVKLNGSTLNYKDYIYVGEGNITFEFNDSTLYYADQVPQNFIATFCSSDDKITNWYSNINDTEFPHELNIYKTNIPCQYSTSDYTGGTITYFYGKSFTCPASGNNPTCSSWGKWTFYSYSGSYQLLNFITTNDDISIDFSSGAVISQNQQIINQNQQIINQGQQTNDKLNDINGSINNDNVDDPSSSINSFKDKIATNGVITQLIGLPVTLFTKVLNSVNGTCSTYNLGSLFGTDLILPCVNIQNYLGTALWSVIDVLISGLFVYSISRKFIKVFESMSSMNEGDVIGD